MAFKEKRLVFSLSPKSASPFCRESARSLAAAYNDGALPCNCDRSGSEGSTCDPAGGQCACRQHVIGRQCTKCATGYYGFPYCRREPGAARAFLPLRFARRRVFKCLLSPVCSVRVRPSPVRRGDGKMHLPPSDGETVLRRVSGPDFQLSPPAGLRRLRMLSDRNQRRGEARLRPSHGTVQVCESTTVCAGGLGS